MIIIPAIIDFQMLCEVLEGIEFLRGIKTLGEFLSVVRLHALDRIGKRLNQVLQKLRGGIRAVLLEGFR